MLFRSSAAMPLRDPSPLFERIEEKGAFIHGWHAPENFWTYVLPETRQLLKKITGTDVLNTFYINSVAFGLKMDTPLAQTFIDEYFQMLKLGTPFLSCFPEECIFMAIYGQRKFRRKWRQHRIPNILKYADPEIDDTPERIEETRSKGFFFYQLRH